MTQIARISFSLLALLLLVAPAHGRKISDETYVCPLTGTTFVAQADDSGTQICVRLDLKKVGFLSSPPLVPICPDDGFVLYKPHFSETELSILRPWVESPEFRQLASEETPYFRIARTQEKLSAPSGDVALSYVIATWEAADGEQYRRYAAIAREKLVPLTAVAAQGGAISPAMAILLIAELERRLGNFDEAQRRLDSLPSGADAATRDTAAYEEELIEKRDSGPHYVPRAREAQCAALDGPATVSTPGVVVTPAPTPTRRAISKELLRP